MIQSHELAQLSAESTRLAQSAATRMMMSCALGGAVGLEREWRHKDSGLRTNMLICMGAALFTIMSIYLAGDSTANHGQVAANIVQGIGFLGAGLILHTKNKVLGLTSAATVFVVAAIGMTCGAGLYLQALIATLLVLVALQIIGAFEARLGWKRYSIIYEVRAQLNDPDQDAHTALLRMQSAILTALDHVGQRLSVLDRDNVAGLERVAFTITATRRTHTQLLASLRASDATDHVETFRDSEED